MSKNRWLKLSYIFLQCYKTFINLCWFFWRGTIVLEPRGDERRNIIMVGPYLFWTFLFDENLNVWHVLKVFRLATSKVLPCESLSSGRGLGAVLKLTGDSDDLRHLPPRVAPHIQVPVGRGVHVVETREARDRHDQLVFHSPVFKTLAERSRTGKKIKERMGENTTSVSGASQLICIKSDQISVLCSLHQRKSH